MATEKSVGEGEVERGAFAIYYREKTAGGYFGLVITEHSYINKEGQASVGQVSVSRDADIEGLKRFSRGGTCERFESDRSDQSCRRQGNLCAGWVGHGSCTDRHALYHHTGRSGLRLTL